MADEINYTSGTQKNTHKLLWAVSGILVLLLVGNLVYFLVTSGSNSGNKSTPTSAANLSTIGTNSNNSSSASSIKVSPSVVKETIPATATSPELQVSFEALDKILGVGEKCTQKQKFVTKIRSSETSGVLTLNYSQSDGYKSGEFNHTFTPATQTFVFDDYIWDTNTGTYFLDLNIISPVTKSFRVGFVNQCIN